MNNNKQLAKLTKENKTQRAARLAELTQDAYMADAYGKSWRTCAMVLINMGLGDKQIEAVLRSKHMRWADDSCGRGDGKQTNSAAFERYMHRWITRDGGQVVSQQIQQLTIETFGSF
jgi:hypothetical protein